MRNGKWTAIWAAVSAAALLWMILIVPGQMKEETGDASGLSPDTWSRQYHTGQIGLDDPLRSFFLHGHHHPDFRMDRLMSGESISRIRFLADETSLSPETAWMILQACDRKNLPLWLVVGLIHVETGGTFRKDLVGRNEDRGLMQITPITEEHLFQRHGHQWSFGYNPETIFAPWYNVTLGTKYLQELADSHQTVDWTRVVSEYNFGPEGLGRYYQRHQTRETPYSRMVFRQSEWWEERYNRYREQARK